MGRPLFVGRVTDKTPAPFFMLTPASATVSNVWLQHDVFWNSYRCLKATVTFQVPGAAGQNCHAVAYVSDGGMFLGAPYGVKAFADNGGNLVGVSGAVRPPTDAETTYTVSLYIPNNAMMIGNKRRNTFIST